MAEQNGGSIGWQQGGDGIGLMLNVGSFVWIMLWCYLALLPTDFVEQVTARWRRRGGQPQ